MMQERPPPSIFDNARRSLRAVRAAVRQQGADPARFVLDEITDEITERLSFMRMKPKRALVIGDPTGRLAKEFASLGAEVTHCRIGELDEEQPLPVSGFDLIVSILSLDTVNDLPGALIHLRHALAPDGLALAALLAAGSLPALRSAMLAADGERPAARMHPLVDAGSGAALMQRAGFARQVADSFAIRASYASIDRLVGDLRDQGLTGVLASQGPVSSKVGFFRARDAFLGQANNDKRVIEEFEILMLTGWKD